MSINKQILVHDLGDMVHLHNLNMDGIYHHLAKLERRCVFLSAALAITIVVADKQIKKLERKIELNAEKNDSNVKDIYYDLEKLHGEVEGLKKTN